MLGIEIEDKFAAVELIDASFFFFQNFLCDLFDFFRVVL